MFNQKNIPHYFWIVGVIIIGYVIQQLIHIIRYNYGELREKYSYKVFMSEESYPNFYTKFGGFPTSYVNTCYNGNKIMPLTLKDFHIASAFRPYQIAGQTYDICSEKAIKTVIEKGARFHFLDIWSSNPSNEFDDSAYPIVRNKTLMTKYGTSIPFDKVCEIYKKHAWTGTKYPLIFYLNIEHTANNRFVLKKTSEIIWKYFKGRLTGAEYSFGAKNIGDIPIRQAMNKLIILTNVHPREGTFQEMVNGIISEKIQNSGKLIIFDEGNVTHGGVKAKTSDMQSVIDYNKTHLGIIIPGDVTDITNLYQPGIDLIQIPAVEPMEDYGFQFVCINYQKPGKERDDYIKFFKNSSLILKKDKVRFIPCPKPEIQKQHIKASYAPRKINFRNGYFEHSF